MKGTKKITLATFKSFIKKNRERVLIKSLSHFDGMSDMVEFSREPRWVEPQSWLPNSEHTLGLAGIWLVGSSRDRFSAYEDQEYIGIECYNCCGSFIIGIEKCKR